MASLVIGALLQLVAAASTPPAEDSGGVLAQDARNPHLFSWKGRPTVLVGAPDHYGAILNLDFDYREYLDLPFDAVMGCVGSLRNCLRGGCNPSRVWGLGFCPMFSTVRPSLSRWGSRSRVPWGWVQRAIGA